MLPAAKCKTCDPFQGSFRGDNSGDKNGNGEKKRPMTLFRRVLPCPPAIAPIDSELGIRLFHDALSNGTMVNYFGLASHFRTQDEPAFCGISTLVMALNALKIDALRIWRESGPWRYFDESMLSCCRSLSEVKENGISLPEWMCLARCNGARVVDFRSGGGESLNDFRKLVIDSAKLPATDRVVVVSYSRKHFLQTGDGHFSTIAGYNPENDATLILDVARFKYPPHWVKLEDIFKAMKSIDIETGKGRGCVVLQPSRLHGTLVFTIRVSYKRWSKIRNFFLTFGEILCSCSESLDQGDCVDCPAKGGIVSKSSIVRCFFKCMPEDVRTALCSYEDFFSSEPLSIRPRDHELNFVQLRNEIETLEVYSLVRDALTGMKFEGGLVVATALLLAFPYPPCANSDTNKETKKEIEARFRSVQDLSSASEFLQEEVATLKKQFEIIVEETNDPLY